MRFKSLLIAALFSLVQLAAVHAVTVQLPAGTMTAAQAGLGGGGNLMIVGAGSGKTTVILTPDSLGVGLRLIGDNIGAKGVTFTGAGLYLDTPNDRNTNVVFDDLAILTAATGKSANAITWMGGLSNFSLTNFHLEAVNGFCVYGQNYDHGKIAWGECVNSAAGMHVAAFGGCNNLLVQGIYLENIRGMGLEFQGECDNVTFRDCWYWHPRLNGSITDNASSFAFSCPLDRGTNILLEHIVVIAPEAPDGQGVPVAIETGGQAKIRNCDLRVHNVAIGCTDGNGNCRVEATDCHVVTADPKNIAVRHNGPTGDLVVSNVGPNAKTDIDLIARGRPLRVEGFANVSATNTNGGNASPLTLTAAVQPITIRGTVTYAVPLKPDGTTHVLISPRATGDNRITDTRVGPTVLMPIAAFPAIVDGYHPAWSVDVQATAYKDVTFNADGSFRSGTALGSTAWTTLQMAGQVPQDSSLPWPPPASTTRPTGSDDSQAIALLAAQLKQAQADLASSQLVVIKLQTWCNQLIASSKDLPLSGASR